MSSTDRAGPAGERPGSVPLGQRLYDNMYLLLVLGVLIMVAVFTGWGLWELATMPQGTLP